MKQTFLLRLSAIVFFCLASLAIKSETSTGKVICPIAKSACSSTKLITPDAEADYKYEPFFIKL